MPENPFQRAVNEGLVNPEPSGRSMEEQEKDEPRRKKRKSKPTSSIKNRKKKIKARYMKARDDAENAGVIPVSPGGAVRDERVPPSEQSEGYRGAAETASLVSRAIRNGWEVPKDNRAKYVDELDAILTDPNAPANVKVAAFNALRLADKDQYERDNPEAAGKAKGATITNTSIAANVLAVQVMRGMFENDVGGGDTALPPPVVPSPLGNSRFDGEVEVGAASTEN